MNAMTDEEQLDGLKSFLKKYGSVVFSAVLIALIALFGWQYWQKKNAAENQNETAKVQLFVDEAKAAQSNPKAMAALSANAEKIVKENPDSIHALETQFVMAKLAFDQQDYAKAERELKKVENTQIADDGLKQIVKLRLSDAQFAQKKYDEALKTLSGISVPSFQSTADEARGDIYVAKNDIENAKKAYQSAWKKVLEAKQERQILQIKLESVGVLVDDPEIEHPILETKTDES